MIFSDTSSIFNCKPDVRDGEPCSSVYISTEWSPVTLTCLLASTIKGRVESVESSSCKCSLATGKRSGSEESTTKTSSRALDMYLCQYCRSFSLPPTGRKQPSDHCQQTLFAFVIPVTEITLTFQELDVQLLFVDRHSVEAICRLHLLLHIACSPAL